MSWESVINGLTVTGLLFYLVYALIYPEKF